jgi:hypothetical protein
LSTFYFRLHKKNLSELETRGSKIYVYKVEQIMGYSCFERAVIASLEILNIRMMNMKVYEGKMQGRRKNKK